MKLSASSAAVASSVPCRTFFWAWPVASVHEATQRGALPSASSQNAPEAGSDALVWEELEARARADGQLTVSFLVFIAIAAVIAGVGILVDSPILIVGAIGRRTGVRAPVGTVHRSRPPPLDASWCSLGNPCLGLMVAAAASLLGTLIFRTAGLAPDRYDLSGRELTAFISRPDGMAAVVAVLAGIVGMLSLTQARSGALIGVLVSVTTIPAVANIGVATAYGEWPELGGASLQLLINILGLVAAGIATLSVQSRMTTIQAKAPRPVQQAKQPTAQQRDR